METYLGDLQVLRGTREATATARTAMADQQPLPPNNKRPIRATRVALMHCPVGTCAMEAAVEDLSWALGSPHFHFRHLQGPPTHRPTTTRHRPQRDLANSMKSRRCCLYLGAPSPDSVSFGGGKSPMRFARASNSTVQSSAMPEIEKYSGLDMSVYGVLVSKFNDNGMKWLNAESQGMFNTYPLFRFRLYGMRRKLLLLI